MTNRTHLLQLSIILFTSMPTNQHKQSQSASSNFQLQIPWEISYNVMPISVRYRKSYLTRLEYHRLDKKCKNSRLAARCRPSWTRRPFSLLKETRRLVNYHTPKKKTKEDINIVNLVTSKNSETIQIPTSLYNELVVFLYSSSVLH